MKTTVFAIALALAAPAFTAFAEESTAPAPSPTTHGWHWRGGKMLEVWKSLTPEEKQKLKTARQAVRNNPDVVAAKMKMKTEIKTFRETRKAAMLKADPTIAPILEKFEAAKTEKK
ncbi:MAG: hypothetical protein PHQ12_07810 [Chthoniobacteraceae bacterium]|nr:hypothetical protein [Chthoniobacteraceae bacterium]